MYVHISFRRAASRHIHWPTGPRCRAIVRSPFTNVARAGSTATATPLAESAAATRHSSGGVGVSPATSGTRNRSQAATGPRPQLPFASP